MNTVLEATYRHARSGEDDAELRIRVGLPYANQEGDWTCDVSFRGSLALEQPVHGIDPLQTFCLAADLIRSKLESAEGSFFWQGEQDPIPLAAYRIGAGFLPR